MNKSLIAIGVFFVTSSALAVDQCNNFVRDNWHSDSLDLSAVTKGNLDSYVKNSKGAFKKAMNSDNPSEISIAMALQEKFAEQAQVLADTIKSYAKQKKIMPQELAGKMADIPDYSTGVSLPNILAGNHALLGDPNADYVTARLKKDYIKKASEAFKEDILRVNRDASKEESPRKALEIMKAGFLRAMCYIDVLNGYGSPHPYDSQLAFDPKQKIFYLKSRPPVGTTIEMNAYPEDRERTWDAAD